MRSRHFLHDLQPRRRAPVVVLYVPTFVAPHLGHSEGMRELLGFLGTSTSSKSSSSSKSDVFCSFPSSLRSCLICFLSCRFSALMSLSFWADAVSLSGRCCCTRFLVKVGTPVVLLNRLCLFCYYGFCFSHPRMAVVPYGQFLKKMSFACE